MNDSPDIIFSQYGQRFPSPNPSWHIPEPQDEPVNKKSRTRREPQKRKQLNSYLSYVINNQKKKGLRLLQIQVVDLSEDDNNTLISAQYVVSESVDNIMDEAERLVNKISKKLCEDSSYV